MPSITYTSKYKKNTGLVLSPQELRDLYFFGVNIVDKAGNELPDSTLEFYIESAQREIEQYLKIKFKVQLFNDNVTYNRDDYMQNGYPMIKTRYPVNEPLSLTGLMNQVESISYPKEWLKAHSNSDGMYLKKLSVIPVTGAMSGSADVILSGITSSVYGFPGWSKTIAEYWSIQYETGFGKDNLPIDILNLVGMLASIPVFAIGGDIAIGGVPGLTGFSLSVDGLSESLSTSASATNSLFGSRIIEYRKSVKETLTRLERIYKGISFTVL